MRMFKEDLVDVLGMEQKMMETTRTQWKQAEHRRRDEENRDAYVMSSYCIEKMHEDKEIRAVCDTRTQAMRMQ